MRVRVNFLYFYHDMFMRGVLAYGCRIEVLDEREKLKQIKGGVINDN